MLLLSSKHPTDLTGQGMPFPANVIRILIASPSDVAIERTIASRVIQNWNVTNSRGRGVVLLPVMWETHFFPTYGQRPQQSLNEQFVDDCDLALGIFWSRLGSSTGDHESGTVEEIERLASLGKPVMLYFSSVPIEPEKIETEQLNRLRAFRDRISGTALLSTYSEHAEFAETLARQLDLQITTVLSAIQNRNHDDQQTPGVDIQVQLIGPSSQQIGTEINVTRYIITVTKPDELPDFNLDDDAIATLPAHNHSVPVSGLAASFINKNYYREMVDHVARDLSTFPLWLWLKNKGTIGARDLHIDLVLSCATGFLVTDSAQLQSPSTTTVGLGGLGFWPPGPAYIPQRQRTREPIRSDFDLRALQPQREIMQPTALRIGVSERASVEIKARIYADTLPHPTEQKLLIRFDIEQLTWSAEEFVDLVDRTYRRAPSLGLQAGKPEPK